MELYGLVLTGGKSQRMRRDKALLRYQEVPHAKFLYDLLGRHCAKTFLSARSGQWVGTELEELPTIPDLREGQGPILGILSAFARGPQACWFVLACDFIRFNDNAAAMLARELDPSKVATCFMSPKGLPEPLCAIYSPLALAPLERASAAGRGPMHVLRTEACRLVAPPDAADLFQANSPEEAALSQP